ncbi:ParB N-terminal domain-containing protein [Mucilaginibacter sp.]|uniref:ParB N-terminal domain-containing protein n=1 Tax=Mucilaginibacter sp. TaxID=1882438 RepID=UPI002C1F402C|nr:ParB N-terminal domain-containing protein [Mucilaginibacter sp.]HTI60381.1 ParB N-terminal domain-containing protein [Mucilaginibacter sp.]
MKYNYYNEALYVEVKTLSIPEYYNKKEIEGENEKLLFDCFENDGIKEPLIINSHPKRLGKIINGVKRFEYAKRKGIVDVPVYFLYLDETDEKRIHYELSIVTREYCIAEIIEYLQQKCLTYIIPNDSQSREFDGLLRQAHKKYEAAPEDNQIRKSTFPLRLSSEFKNYPEKLQKMYGSKSQNEAIVKLLTDAVEGRIVICY